MFVTLTQFLHNIGISIHEFIAADDDSILKGCLIIKFEYCSTLYEDRYDFDYICAPFLL